MRQYLDLLRKIMDEGVTVQTGAYLPGEQRQPTARRLHGVQLRFNLWEGFPAVTTKPLWWRAVVAEWIWFMQGSGKVDFLRTHGVSSIWEPWVKKIEKPHIHGGACYVTRERGVSCRVEDGEMMLACDKTVDVVDSGELGPVYGRQFRRMQGVKWANRPAKQPEMHFHLDKLLREGTLLRQAGSVSEYAYLGYRYVVSRHDRVDGCMGEQDGPAYGIHSMGPHHEVVETDQIGNARDDIRAVIADPFNRARRRIIVSLWNAAQVPDMALPPCHTFHMYDMVPPLAVNLDGPQHEVVLPGFDEPRWTLNLHLSARSIDAVKGLPFNIASYALMLSVMSHVTGCAPGTLTITFNDVHIYDNQFADVAEQLGRSTFPLPRLQIEPAANSILRDLTIEEAEQLIPGMFTLINYVHHSKLKSESEVAV